ncbi:hypothetical protein [Myxosarcina sp. GI1(2024)]
MDNHYDEKTTRDTANEGDIIDESKSKEEKAEQVAVESWDIAGKVETPAYFEVETEDGEKEELHHVKDAQEISDVVRQARTDEKGDRQWW